MTASAFLELLSQTKETSSRHWTIRICRSRSGRRPPKRSGGHNPLFQAKFNYMREPRGFDGVEGLEAETRIVDLVGSHFDLALDIIYGPTRHEGNAQLRERSVRGGYDRPDRRAVR